MYAIRSYYEFENFDVGREERDRVGEARELHVVGGDVDDAARRRACERAEQARIETGRNAGQRQPRSGGQVIQSVVQRNVLT